MFQEAIEKYPDQDDIQILAHFGLGTAYDLTGKYEEAKQEYGIDVVAQPEQATYDAIILAVGHEQFRALNAESIRAWGKSNHVLYDVKYVLNPEDADGRL